MLLIICTVVAFLAVPPIIQREPQLPVMDVSIMHVEPNLPVLDVNFRMP